MTIGEDGTIYARNPSNGCIFQKFKTQDHIYNSAALLSDQQGKTNAIYFGSTDGNMYALKPDGTLLWRFDTGAPIRSSPVLGRKPVGQDGWIVYFSCGNGKLYALDASNGKRRWSFIIGSGTWILTLLAIASLRSDQVTLGYILAVMSGLGIATTYVIPWAMLPDVIEQDELQTGQRREGSYYAVAAFFQKLGTGLALWIMAQILAWTGYITPAVGSDILPQQPSAAISATRLFAGLVSAVLLSFAIVFAWRYPISRQEHIKNLHELTHR